MAATRTEQCAPVPSIRAGKANTRWILINPPLVSAIVPTYNERENIRELVLSLLDELGHVGLEVVVVDDASPDGTANLVRDLAQIDSRVHLLERTRKQGLSSAIFAGDAFATGRFIAVLDADFSHDPAELTRMLSRAQAGYDVVIGSRFVSGGGFANQHFTRRVLSRILNLSVRAALQLRPRDVLTGYVLCRRDLLLGVPTRYSARGFKWLLELLVTHRGVQVFEWPITFRNRRHGHSKASFGEAVGLVVLCLRLTLWRFRQLLKLD